MKKIILLFVSVILSCTATFAQGRKTLVAYFSATGNTEQVARKIAEATNSDLHEITPAVPYNSEDLNWHNKNSRSSVEMADASSRPAIKKNLNNIADYDIIYLGYPIWWDQAPKVINTFLETYNISRQRVIPFATSGGSDITNSVKELKKTYPNIKWDNGKLLNHATNNDIKNWIKSL